MNKHQSALIVNALDMIGYYATKSQHEVRYCEEITEEIEKLRGICKEVKVTMTKQDMILNRIKYHAKGLPNTLYRNEILKDVEALRAPCGEASDVKEIPPKALDEVSDVMSSSTQFGVFVARKEGCCIRVSIPAKTGNDWGSKTEFLDFPLMDKECFDNFVKIIPRFAKLFEGE